MRKLDHVNHNGDFQTSSDGTAGTKEKKLQNPSSSSSSEAGCFEQSSDPEE